MRASIVAATAVLSLFACATPAPAPATPPSPPHAITTPPIEAAAEPAVLARAADDIAERCSAPRKAHHPYTNAAELRALVVGRWVDCTPTTPRTGLELTKDGRWYVLEQQRDGAFARRPVVDFADPFAGPYEIVDDMSKHAPAPRVPGFRRKYDGPNRGSEGYLPELSDGPRTMTLGTTRYVPLQ